MLRIIEETRTRQIPPDRSDLDVGPVEVRPLRPGGPSAVEPAERRNGT